MRETKSFPTVATRIGCTFLKDSAGKGEDPKTHLNPGEFLVDGLGGDNAEPKLSNIHERRRVFEDPTRMKEPR